MRKIYLLISVTLLLLVGCSNETLHFKGESEHWRGKYTTNIDGNREDGLNERLRGFARIDNPIKLVKHFQNITLLKYKFIALDRLASAHNKTNMEDKFIDLMIALESMFPSITSEVTFRIALYTATLLDRGYDTYKTVKDLYKTRSNLVHGSSKLSREQLAKQLEELDVIVRKVIVQSLEYQEKGVGLGKMEEDIVKVLLPN